MRPKCPAYRARPHRVIFLGSGKGNLVTGAADPLLADADVAIGQPDPDQVIALPRLRWVHLTSHGYTRYDRAIAPGHDPTRRSAHQQFQRLR